MTTALLSLLFFCFSLFLSSRSFFSFLSRKKIMYFPSCIKKSSTRWCFEENFFVFFCTHKRSTKGAQKEHKRSTKGAQKEKDEHTISFSSSSIIIIHQSSYNVFSSLLVVTPTPTTKTHHTTTPFTGLFLRLRTRRERERACVRLRERERERRSLSESERVCSFYVSCGL